MAFLGNKVEKLCKNKWIFIFTFIFRIHFKENLSLKWILESCHFCSFFSCFSRHFSKCCKIPLVKRGEIQFPRFETNRVFFIPQEAQVHQNINLPLFSVLYPLGSRHSVCFFSFTQYDFILNEIIFFHSELIYFTMIFSFSFGLEEENIFKMSWNDFPLFFLFLAKISHHSHKSKLLKGMSRNIFQDPTFGGGGSSPIPFPFGGWRWSPFSITFRTNSIARRIPRDASIPRNPPTCPLPTTSPRFTSSSFIPFFWAGEGCLIVWYNSTAPGGIPLPKIFFKNDWWVKANREIMRFLNFVLQFRNLRIENNLKAHFKERIFFFCSFERMLLWKRMSAIDAISFLSLAEVFPAWMDAIPRESRVMREFSIFGAGRRKSVA